MLSSKQIKEIRDHLERAQNPVFFFDNDQDGLCSFLLLQRYIGRGKGVPIRSFPSLDRDYLRKVHELKSDYIFILDKPLVSKGFFEEVEKENIPIVWIDHHQMAETFVPDYVNYYNPAVQQDEDGKKSYEPVTYICHQIVGKKDDLWIALIGCISDKFLPDFFENVKKEFPELMNDSNDAFGVFYGSQLGRIARILGFGLKDKTTNVIQMLKFLMKVKSPYDVLDTDNINSLTMHERYEQLYSKYQKFLQKAIALADETSSDKILFFQYGGDMSISSDLSNELSYLYTQKVIVVVYVTGVKANISVRGKKIKNLVLEAVKGIENATAGGHEDAVGATVRLEDLEQFKRRLTELVKE